MILSYAVKAPLHCRAGPIKPPLRLKPDSDSNSQFQNSASQCLLPAVSPPVVFRAVPSWDHLSRQGPGLTNAVSLLQASPSMQEVQMPLSFFWYPFSQTGRLWWLTPWPALKPQGCPGADVGMTRGHLWDAISGATTAPNTTITQAPSRPIFDCTLSFRVPITAISTHFKSVGSDCSHTQENQAHSDVSPENLSSVLLFRELLLSPSAFTFSALHKYIFNLLSSASTWYVWGRNHDSCLQRDFSTLIWPSPVCWMMLIW